MEYDMMQTAAIVPIDALSILSYRPAYFVPSKKTRIRQGDGRFRANHLQALETRRPGLLRERASLADTPTVHPKGDSHAAVGRGDSSQDEQRIVRPEAVEEAVSEEWKDPGQDSSQKGHRCVRGPGVGSVSIA